HTHETSKKDPRPCLRHGRSSRIAPATICARRTIGRCALGPPSRDRCFELQVRCLMRISTVAVFAALFAGPTLLRAAPLAGRWEGVFHGGRGDQAVVLICRPGTSGALSGLLYMGGDLMGPLENGMAAGDSLHFNVLNFEFRARRDNDRMNVR